MDVEQMEDGTLLVPAGGEIEIDGNVVMVDGQRKVYPGDPDFQEWLDQLVELSVDE